MSQSVAKQLTTRAPVSGAQYTKEDLEIFAISLSAAELAALDAVTAGKRTCPDWWAASPHLAPRAPQRCNLTPRSSSFSFKQHALGSGTVH